MKNSKICLLILAICAISCNQSEETPFTKYFSDGSLRIDYFHTGDANTEEVKIDQTFHYAQWAGSKVNLIDELNYGAYYHKIYDEASQELIYSRGFDSYFKEYQVSTPAIEGEVKEFHESAIIPRPKSNFVFALEKRSKEGAMVEVFRTTIDLNDAKKAPLDNTVKTYASLDNGSPNLKADVVIIGEGYSDDEVQKFQDDLERFTEIFFRAEPCRSNKGKFNIRGVLKPSIDSGIDEPNAGIDKNTAVNATFNSMGSERYVLTEDNKSLRDIAGHVPYDALYIMVNHSRYGGGGIYNFYCTYTSDNINSAYLMVHEFGHSFFGLADEYYTSSTAYNDFYSADYEPSEPNITALKDPENVKWKALLTEDIEVPTQWPKSKFDSLDGVWQAKRKLMNENTMALQKSGASAEEVSKAKVDYNTQSLDRDEKVQDYLENSGFAGKVGAFEGAGYASTGLYRPSINCIMFTRTDFFCPVCQDAMVKVIDSYSK
ncbi:MAG: hypothetical protein JXQ96_06920 [Cyclobacteriaceae bacterium]